MKKRRKARELALQGLYAWEIKGGPTELVVADLEKWGGKDAEIQAFARKLLRTAIQNKETLDKEVAGIVENWEFQRMALLDRLILRMALCELLYFEEIPPKVTINEAIEIAKIYSTHQSGRFVNGILDSLYQKYKSENKIEKKGRGLVA